MELGNVVLNYKDGSKVSLTFDKLTVRKPSVIVEHSELGFFYAGLHELKNISVEVFDYEFQSAFLDDLS